MTTPAATTSVALPLGFSAHVAHIGIKDETDDFVVIAAERPVPAAAVFTRSRFAGVSVTISRSHVTDGMLRGCVVISKNANVATGRTGEANAREVLDGVASSLGCSPTDLLLASTGVIGRQYPMEVIRGHLATVTWPFEGRDALAAARGIMTTDTRPKWAHSQVTASDGGTANVVGIAKGVGMIEPDMATMIALVFTDAEVSPAELDVVFREVVADTFNSLSIDTDTSTSDTAAVFASGEAGPVEIAALRNALGEVCLSLTRQLATDGEGAEKLLVVSVTGGRDHDQAKRVAKAVVNSPLVKTAVHGADPNWGRVAMAIGKCSDDTDIDQERVTIRFAEREVYPTQLDETGLAELSEALAADEVHIDVDLGIADGSATVYGCDLTDGYIRINADYTT